MNSPFETYFDDTQFQSHEAWEFGDLIATLGRSFFLEQQPGPIFGTPGEDAQNWTEQTTPFTCAVVSQEMILHAFGVDASEAQLTYEATANGWLTEGGTSMENMSKLLELHGVSTHTVPNGSVDALVSELAQGHKVIVGVDSGEMWRTDSPWEDFFQNAPDHAIVVTGLDMSNASHPKVYINDPGDPEGAGKAYSLDQFLDAWADAGNMYVATDHAPPDLATHSLFGANFNPDSGMYMDTGFWETFLRNLAQDLVKEVSSSGFHWPVPDQAAVTINPWEQMSSAERNGLFMKI